MITRITRRQARRKLGSRRSRREGGNGKIMSTGGGGKNSKRPCRRNPLPSKRLGWRVQAILDSYKVEEV